LPKSNIDFLFKCIVQIFSKKKGAKERAKIIFTVNYPAKGELTQLSDAEVFVIP